MNGYTNTLYIVDALVETRCIASLRRNRNNRDNRDNQNDRDRDNRIELPGQHTTVSKTNNGFAINKMNHDG